MKFTVEVEEFWLDEESELSAELKNYVSRTVINDIQKSISDKVEKQITIKLTEVINDKLALIIDDKLTELLALETIVVSRNEISISDHIKNIFQSNTGWSNPKHQVEEIAKKFGQEMRVQYNMAFANNIVANMKEQGFLKDDVVKILLEGK